MPRQVNSLSSLSSSFPCATMMRNGSNVSVCLQFRGSAAPVNPVHSWVVVKVVAVFVDFRP